MDKEMTEMMMTLVKQQKKKRGIDGELEPGRLKGEKRKNQGL